MDEASRRAGAETAAGGERGPAMVRSLRTMRVSWRRGLCELVQRPGSLMLLTLASAAALAAALVTVTG